MSTSLSTSLSARPYVTDGGLETDLIFNHGVDLPAFAAYPLLDSDEGRALLTGYYDAYADIARRAGAGLVLESPTWRANPAWGATLGHSRDDVRRYNAAAVALMQQLRERHADLDDVVVSGAVGPRGDGYVPGARMSPDEAADHHAHQVSALAEAGADLVSAWTLVDTAEAVGVVRAARASGVPVAVAFTVETDGRLPDGTTLADAVAEVDALAPPDHFQVNCAHPTHVARAFAGVDGSTDGAWRERIVGICSNASTASHAELDEATELDDGDPAAFAADHAALAAHLPALTVRGGCCGTDARHVAALWGVA